MRTDGRSAVAADRQTVGQRKWPMKLVRETVKSGVWLYDKKAPTSVRVIRQNWDAHHEEGYDTDPPDLNQPGEAYYVVYGDDVSDGHYRNMSRTCGSLEEAVELAESTIIGSIEWDRAIWKNDASITPREA